MAVVRALSIKARHFSRTEFFFGVFIKFSTSKSRFIAHFSPDSFNLFEYLWFTELFSRFVPLLIFIYSYLWKHFSLLFSKNKSICIINEWFLIYGFLLEKLSEINKIFIKNSTTDSIKFLTTHKFNQIHNLTFLINRFSLIIFLKVFLEQEKHWVFNILYNNNNNNNNYKKI